MYKRILKFRTAVRARSLLRRGIVSCCSNSRSTWAFKRNTDVWQDVNTTWTTKDWHDNVRMSQQTFWHVCNMVRERIEKRTTRFRAAIPVEKRVMMTLWRLATVLEFRTLRVIVRENRAGAKDRGRPISTKFSAIKDYPIR